METTKSVQALLQTREQQSTEAVTYRVYLDHAWRNVQAPASWKNLPQQELLAKLEAVYFTPK